MKSVLITGGAGFIGSNLTLKLVDLGYEVTVLDNLSKQIHGDNPENSELYCSIKDKVRFIRGSVSSKDDWISAISGNEIVIHLAAETGTGQSMYEISKYTEVNIQGTSIFLDLLTNIKHSVKKVLIASSRSIYGEGKYHCHNHGFVYPHERNDCDMARGDFAVKCPICKSIVNVCPTDEASMIHPSSVYGITKQIQEQMFMVVGKSLNIPAVALRFQNVYGAGQSLTNPYTGILSIFSTRIKNGNDIVVFEDGEESRDFIYVDDVVKSIVLSIQNDIANYEVFNVGSGQQTSVRTVAELLKSSYCSNINITVSGNYRLGDIRHNFADMNKIKSMLNFEPDVPFELGIKKFVDWVNNQQVKDDGYERSLIEMRKKGMYK